MSDLQEHLARYLTLRRGLGFKLVNEGRLLADFVTFADAAGERTITIEAALRWARLPTGGCEAYLSQRLRAVRGFARYLHPLDSATEVPPLDLLPSRRHRPAPYLYSEHDVLALLVAARGLRPPLRAATWETLIGLLSCTGIRIGEAMRLDGDDIDWSNRLLRIRDSKFGKSREVLIHPTTITALADYAETRGRLRPDGDPKSVLITTRGTRLTHKAIYPTFHALLREAGLEPTSASRNPRLHDLRHSFAVKTLLSWYRNGDDVAARMPLLSTYLGHVDPAATYWYLTAAPELLALAARRLEHTGEQAACDRARPIPILPAVARAARSRGRHPHRSEH